MAIATDVFSKTMYTFSHDNIHGGIFGNFTHLKEKIKIGPKSRDLWPFWTKQGGQLGR